MQFKVWARLPHTLGVSSYQTVYCLLPSACFNATSTHEALQLGNN
jgi:hypothetical protein